MKLQCTETRRGDAVYEKFQLVVPKDYIDQAKWHKGDEIQVTVDRNHHIVLSKQGFSKEIKKTYDEVRTKIKSILDSEPNGLFWADIHKKDPTLPIKPNPIWVNRFENDFGLERSADKQTGRKIWRIPINRH